MDCTKCKEIRNTIPYIAHEAAEARHERHIKRLIIALVVTVLLMFGSNAMWLYAWMQYDYTTETVTDTYEVDVDADSGGNANYIGKSGDIYNGTSESD